MAFFNPIRPSYTDNPYPSLAQLRAREPVYFSPEVDAWIVTRYEDCMSALRDEVTFSSDLSAVGGGGWWDEGRARHHALIGDAQLLTRSDSPDHERMREVVSSAFTPRAVHRLRPHIESVVARLLDDLTPGEPFDLMERFARPLPRLVIAEQLGLADADHDAVLGAAGAIMRGLGSEDHKLDASHARDGLCAYFERARAEGTGHDGGGVLARMLEAHGAGTLSGAELLALTIDVAMAGNQATANLIGNVTLALLRHPDEFASLRDDPSRVADALDECIRYDSSITAVVRVVTRDTRIGRRQLPKGSVVYLMTGAANRDPEQFPAPDHLDLAREERRHLAFGAGIHICLGISLARLEVEVAITALQARFPTLRLAAPVERQPGIDHRGPHRLMVAAG